MQAAIFLPTPPPFFPPSCLALDALGVINETSCFTLVLFPAGVQSATQTPPASGASRIQHFSQEKGRVVLLAQAHGSIGTAPQTPDAFSRVRCREEPTGISQNSPAVKTHLRAQSAAIERGPSDIAPTIRSVATRRKKRLSNSWRMTASLSYFYCIVRKGTLWERARCRERSSRKKRRAADRRTRATRGSIFAAQRTRYTFIGATRSDSAALRLSTCSYTVTTTFNLKLSARRIYTVYDN
jgi:hypothetical protein